LTYPYAYVSIAEGCNVDAATAQYEFWGSLKSRPAAEIVDEINELYEIGIREVILVSQDTGAWAQIFMVDLHWSFAKGSARYTNSLDSSYVRQSYVHNRKTTFSLERHCSVLPYFDIPVQSGSDKVLSRCVEATTESDSTSFKID